MREREGTIRKGIKKITKAIRLGAESFVVCYTLASVLAISDYHLFHKKWLEEHMRNELVISTYETDLEGRMKTITIVGENHLYNRVEAKFSKEFVQQCDVVLYEGSDVSVFDDKTIMTKAVWIPPKLGLKVAYKFASLGNGRWITHATIDSSAHEYNRPVYRLENKTNGGLDLVEDSTIATLYAYGMIGGMFAPLLYWGAKEESREGYHMDPTEREDAHTMFKVKERDERMARNAASLIRTLEEEHYCIVVGSEHIPGFTENLRQLLPMRETPLP